VVKCFDPELNTELFDVKSKEKAPKSEDFEAFWWRSGIEPLTS
jgi:hypothetical protein